MEALPFGIKVIRESDVQTVYLSGELDFLATLELTPQLDDIARYCSGETLFDLEQVTLIDSEAIKMLLRAFALVINRRGLARVIRCSERACRIIKIAGADAIFGMQDDKISHRTAYGYQQ